MHRTTKARAHAALLALCGAAGLALCASAQAAVEPAHPKALDDAIIAAAKRHGVPEHLVRRIIMRESKYDPRARNHKYWGLMQISYPTAKSMGFKGTREELLNPVVNLRYAVPYLANAFVIAGKSEDAAVRLYAAGYYVRAKTRGLLNVLRTADSAPLNGVPDDPPPMLAANTAAQPPQSTGAFGGLFGSEPQPQIAYAADASAAQPPVVAPQAAQSAPVGLYKGPVVDMVAGKNGTLAPPKKWTRDGGTTSVARGEQAPATREAPEESGRRRSRKITIAASFDAPASSAQAYASPATPNAGFADAASQAAIAQATAAQAATGQPIGAQQQVATAAQPTTSPATADDDDAKPARHKRKRHAKRHRRGGTEVAEGKATPSEAQPALPPTAAQ